MPRRPPTNMSVVAVVVLTMAALFTSSECARILALVPYNARSHFVVMEPLLTALSARGHQLTVVSSFPSQLRHHNRRDVDLSTQLPPVISNYTLEDIKEFMPDLFRSAIYITHIHMSVCEQLFKDQRVMKLLEEKFDLMIGEIFGSDCFNYFAHKMKVPLVSWVTSTALPWMAARTGLPDNPSYIPNYFVDYAPNMTFMERLFNTVTLLYAKAVYQFYSQLPSRAVAEEALREPLPYMDEVNRRTSLVLVNSHYSLSQSRPLPPNVVEVGGIHVNEPKPLPKDLQEFLDGAKHGAILFSFGSLVRVSSLPRHVILMFMDVFATLPQRVIFKYEDELPEAPPNVLVRKWLPQTDIIAHESVRAVITHGGLASTIEAVHFAKPLVGVPFFSDQYQNVKNVERRAAGVVLDIDQLTQRDILEALRRVLDDPRYADSMMRLSLQFRDRPMAALQSAVYWTEYVIRHKGAPHLRPASVSLPLYQYLLLDVIAVLLTAITAVVYVTCFIIRFLCSLICSRGKRVVSKQKMKKSKKTD